MFKEMQSGSFTQKTPDWGVAGIVKVKISCFHQQSCEFTLKFFIPLGWRPTCPSDLFKSSLSARSRTFCTSLTIWSLPLKKIRNWYSFWHILLKREFIKNLSCLLPPILQGVFWYLQRFYQEQGWLSHIISSNRPCYYEFCFDKSVSCIS